MAVNFTFGNAFSSALNAAYQRALQLKLQSMAISNANKRFNEQLKQQKFLTEEEINAADRRLKAQLDTQIKLSNAANKLRAQYYDLTLGLQNVRNMLEYQRIRNTKDYQNKMIKVYERNADIRQKQYQLQKDAYEEAKREKENLTKGFFSLLSGGDEIGNIKLPDLEHEHPKFSDGTESKMTYEEVADRMRDAQVRTYFANFIPRGTFLEEPAVWTLKNFVAPIVMPIFGIKHPEDIITKNLVRKRVGESLAKTKSFLMDLGKKNPAMRKFSLMAWLMARNNANTILQQMEAFPGEEQSVQTSILPYSSMLQMMALDNPLAYYTLLQKQAQEKKKEED